MYIPYFRLIDLYKIIDKSMNNLKDFLNPIRHVIGTYLIQKYHNQRLS